MTAMARMMAVATSRVPGYLGAAGCQSGMLVRTVTAGGEMNKPKCGQAGLGGNRPLRQAV